MRVKRIAMAVALGLALAAVTQARAQQPWGGVADPHAALVMPVADPAPRGEAAPAARPDGPAIDASLLAAREAPARPATRGEGVGLGGARARILLQSLTVPGWGQATLGHRTASRVFLLAEAGVWASFTAFRVQEVLRRQSYERTARLFAGIDLDKRDEEFRRIVGAYLSSDEYNRLVVARDAANLYYNDPAAMRAYIDAHALSGRDAWDWGDVDNLLRYRAQRKNTQRAALRANTALAVAVADRLLSALHAARGAAHAHAWNLEVSPVDTRDPVALRLGVRTRF